MIERRLWRRRSMRLRPSALATVLLVLAAIAPGLSADDSLLTLDRILVDEDFETESSPRLRWLDDGSHYTTLEEPGGLSR